MAAFGSDEYYANIVDIFTTQLDFLTPTQKTIGVEGILKIVKEQHGDFVSKVLLGDKWETSNNIMFNIVALLNDEKKLNEFVCIFEKDCAAEMVKECVYSIYDLKRMLESFPHHATKIMKFSIDAKKAPESKYFTDEKDDQTILTECINKLAIANEIKKELLSQSAPDFLAASATTAPKPM